MCQYFGINDKLLKFKYLLGLFITNCQNSLFIHSEIITLICNKYTVYVINLHKSHVKRLDQNVKRSESNYKWEDQGRYFGKKWKNQHDNND